MFNELMGHWAFGFLTDTTAFLFGVKKYRALHGGSLLRYTAASAIFTKSTDMIEGP